MDGKRRILGVCDDGVIVEHDGVSEDGYCARCGSHLDATVHDPDDLPDECRGSDGRWNGACWRCGAGRDQVGCIDLTIHPCDAD